MSTPFLGELRTVAFNFPPKSWAFCNGQLMSIAQNQALFALLGTTYGGDGRTTFALPNLQGRNAMHRGNTFTQGQVGGETTHTLTAGEVPAHTHSSITANSATGNAAAPNGALPAGAGSDVGNIYAGAPPVANQTTLSSSAIASVGGGQAHNNMQPYLVLNFCIALSGIFPSRN